MIDKFNELNRQLEEIEKRLAKDKPVEEVKQKPTMREPLADLEKRFDLNRIPSKASSEEDCHALVREIVRRRYHIAFDESVQNPANRLPLKYRYPSKYGVKTRTKTQPNQKETEYWYKYHTVPRINAMKLERELLDRCEHEHKHLF